MRVGDILKSKSTVLENRSQMAVDCCVLNQDTGLEAIQLMKTGGEAIHNSEQIFVIQDQIIPPNSPEVSTKQQQFMQFAEQTGCQYTYGTGMASHQLTRSHLKGGEVVVSADRDILMVGAVGALGVCVGAAKLSQAMVYGKVIIPTPKTLKVKIVGQMKDNVDIRDAAMCLTAKIKDVVSEDTVIEFYDQSFAFLSLSEKMILCGWMQKTGALSALMVSDSCDEVDDTLNLSEVPSVIMTPGVNQVCDGKTLPEQDVRVVFIGGAYGGQLEDMRKTAGMVRGRQLAYQVRLVVAPATADIYVAMADQGYLIDIMEAGGMVINQCGNPAVQGRIGSDEVMVSNDIHNESGYAGPQDSKIFLTSTDQAVRCALNGKIGGES